MKEKKEDGKTAYVHGSTDLKLEKWFYYQKQSTDSMKSPTKLQ
jgi:hypothetical protein